MRDRVAGFENEYAIVVAEKSDGRTVFWRPDIHKPVHISKEFLVDFASHIPDYALGAPSWPPISHAWMSNGGLVYMESAGGATHPEYASPESRKIIDVVRYN